MYTRFVTHVCPMLAINVVEAINVRLVDSITEDSLPHASNVLLPDMALRLVGNITDDNEVHP